MKTQRPLILISNDDGYFAKGLQVLINTARKLADIIVVAPETGESGMSHAITIRTPLRINKRVEEDGFVLYSINGTPVDSIKMALHRLVDRKPDLILSGINHGSNASVSLLYSGTLGAAREGCLSGIPSIGLSLLNHDADADFSIVEKYLYQIIAEGLKNGIADQTLLNINFPNIKPEDCQGVKVCRQTKGFWKEEYDERKDPHGGTYFWLKGDFENHEPSQTDTDEWALSHNYIAVVPVQIDTTSYKQMETIGKWDWYGK